MKIFERKLVDLTPYEKNPRKNDRAVEYVSRSISQFGFKVPMVITPEGVIVCGHTRYKAAQKLGLQKVPCVIADDLTEEQIRAFRLADNKVGEMAEWDEGLLGAELLELESIDMSDFAFDVGALAIAGGQAAAENRKAEEWFNDADRLRDDLDEQSDEYQEFVQKFEAKKTTDDCYTPDLVYGAVCDWVEKEYKVDRKNFVRPFYPGGDFEKYEYKKTDIVVDNPPFSILTKITDFYVDHKIPFFLFCSGLTGISGAVGRKKCACVAAYADIEYANGALVVTSFLTSLEDDRVLMRTAPDLTKAVEKASNDSKTVKQMPKYSYPVELITAAMLGYLSKHDTQLTIRKSDAYFVRALDAQKEMNKAIFGGGFLLSEKAAAEKAAAEKAAAEKAAAEKAAAEKAAAQRFELSERELQIIKGLGNEEASVEEEN